MTRYERLVDAAERADDAGSVVFSLHGEREKRCDAKTPTSVVFAIVPRAVSVSYLRGIAFHTMRERPCSVSSKRKTNKQKPSLNRGICIFVIPSVLLCAKVSQLF